jgi:hypothetical protein
VVSLDVLVDELKSLRKGRGVSAGDIHRRVGPWLRAACEVTKHDDSGQVRRKVAATLESLAATLPEDLRLAVLAGLGLLPDVRYPRYEDRVAWVAGQLGRLPRTARRRIDEGIRHVAELIVESLARSECPTPEDAWRTTDLRMTVTLDSPNPEVVEQRRIVSQQSALTELDLAITVPADNVQVDVLHGGIVEKRLMESSERLGFTLVLPRPLAQGESHAFALQYTFASEADMRPYAVCVPRYPCAQFDLTVRFGEDRLPTRLWLLNRVFQRDAADPRAPGKSVEPEAEKHVRFRDLSPGLAYGLRWEWTGQRSSR